MKKVFFAFFAAAALLCACNKEKVNDTGEPLFVDFTVTPAAVYVGEAVSLDADVKGGATPYNYKWKIGDEEQALNRPSLTYTFSSSNSYVVKLEVTDGKGAVAQKQKVVVVNAPKIPEEGELALNWVGKMMGYNTKSAAAVADDGSVYSTCRDNKLYKWSSTGNSVWVKDILSGVASTVVGYGTPSIDTDGTVFISSGNSDGKGVLKAFKADGSLKWNFSEWYASSGTPAPTTQGTLAAIDGDNVYFGHTGTNGIVMSVNKSTGARNGFCAPAGGARSGIVISKNGYACWFGGKYGAFGIAETALDAGGNDPLTGQWRAFASKQATNSYEGQIALVNIASEPCVTGVYTDETGTKVYAVKASDGTVVSETYITDTETQDQGGVVVDKNGYVIASLNNTLGSDNGGIAIVDPASGTLVARFRTQEKVSGSPAVDKAGNIHFGTESGYYYVVKQNGSDCDLLVKRNLATLITGDHRYAAVFEDLGTAKIWSSPVIGDDGKIYICFTDNATRAFGGVACLSFEGCQGPADSDWPMIGHDRRHTGKQN